MKKPLRNHVDSIQCWCNPTPIRTGDCKGQLLFMHYDKKPVREITAKDFPKSTDAKPQGKTD